MKIQQAMQYVWGALLPILYLVFKRGVKHLGFSFMPKFTSGVALKSSCTKSGVAQ